MKFQIKGLITAAAAVFIVGAVGIGQAFGQDSLQKAVASKEMKFASVSPEDKAYKSAIDAHDLAGAKLLDGKQATFRGTVTQVYFPRSGTIAILNFDKDYKTAMTAVVNKAQWSKFPDLTDLVGKEVVIVGKFSDFHGAMQIVLIGPNEIGIVGH